MNQNCKIKNSSKSQGFTLLEILIAVGVFSVISAMSFIALNQYFAQSEQVEKAHEKIEQIQRLFSLLEQDLRYIVARPVQYNNTTYAAFEVYSNRPVFEGEKMQLSTSRPTPLYNKLQTSYRVSWRFNDNTISRYSWKELDLKSKIFKDYEPEIQHLQHIIEDVKSFDVSATVSTAEEELDAFNEKTFSNDFDESLYLLPNLVTVSVTLNNNRNYYRILPVAFTTEN